MEQLNKVILRGIIGSVKTFNVGDRKGARLTVATNLAYKGQDGCCVIETTWHNITAWEGYEIQGLDKLGKGDRVEIIGRLRNQRYIGEDGGDRYSSEILSSKLTTLSDDEPMMYQI